MTWNERYYRRVMTAIGGAMLIFLLLINLLSIGMLPFTLFLEHSPSVFSEVLYQLVYAIGYFSSFTLPILFLKLFLRRSEHVYRSMMLSRGVSPYLPLILPAAIAVVYASAYLNDALVNIVLPSQSLDEVLTEPDLQKPYALVLNILVVCIVPAFCEEMLFRGAILTNCLPFGRTKAIFISALLFALMHQNLQQILYTFVAGLVLGVVYTRTESLWNCILLHLVNNSVSILQLFIAGKIEDANAEAASLILLDLILLFIGCLALAYLLIRFFSRKQDFHEGFFKKDLPASDFYAEVPIPSGAAVRRFLTPTMCIFLVCCILQMLLLWAILALGVI